jgi:hypothetical protein
MFPDGSGSPAVKVSWSPNIFSKGNSNRFRWQVWRDDVFGSPVITAPGGTTFAYDTSLPRDVTWANFGGVIGGTTCDFDAAPDETATAVPGPTPGRAHLYRVELVYKLSSLDLPGGGGGDATDCYFVTSQTQARGVATPLFRPELQTPGSGEDVPAPVPGDPIFDQVTFTFNSVVLADPITVEYILEVSTSPNSTRNSTRKIGTTVSTETGLISIIAENNFFTAPGTTVWWRVGARNVADRPGPVKDALGERYIFSAVRSFKRPTAPPPPPAN